MTGTTGTVTPRLAEVAPRRRHRADGIHQLRRDGFPRSDGIRRSPSRRRPRRWPGPTPGRSPTLSPNHATAAAPVRVLAAVPTPGSRAHVVACPHRHREGRHTRRSASAASPHPVRRLDTFAATFVPSSASRPAHARLGASRPRRRHGGPIFARHLKSTGPATGSRRDVAAAGSPVGPAACLPAAPPRVPAAFTAAGSVRRPHRRIAPAAVQPPCNRATGGNRPLRPRDHSEVAEQQRLGQYAVQPAQSRWREQPVEPNRSHRCSPPSPSPGSPPPPLLPQTTDPRAVGVHVRYQPLRKQDLDDHDRGRGRTQTSTSRSWTPGPAPIHEPAIQRRLRPVQRRPG